MKTSTLAPVTALLVAALACSVSIPTVKSRQHAAGPSQPPTGSAKKHDSRRGDAADEPQLKAAGSGSAWPVIPALDRGVRTARAVAEPISISIKDPALRPGRKPDDVVIDIIVAYTKAASSDYGNIERELVETAVLETNQSFVQSHLGHVRLRLVHTYQTDYAEEGSHFDHVWRFADKGDGYMDEIHQLRDLYRADVAVLVVDDRHGCGLATRVGADADEAFAVVHHACAVRDFTLAHELGHLIGASHDLGYANGTQWRDIMSLTDSCGGCPRVPVWSNPNVLVRGEPAGTAKRDNARVIAEGAARVAAFR